MLRTVPKTGSSFSSTNIVNLLVVPARSIQISPSLSIVANIRCSLVKTSDLEGRVDHDWLILLVAVQVIVLLVVRSDTSHCWNHGQPKCRHTVCRDSQKYDDGMYFRLPKRENHVIMGNC